MMRFRTGILVLACVKLGCFAASDIRTIQPFSELDLCLPFNVRACLLPFASHMPTDL